jgi:WhiB family transcriptional regulator, redox-sensing transcriptional regulator
MEDNMDTEKVDAAGELICVASQPGDWRVRALCAQVDPDIFFPEKGESPAAAKRVCASCEVRAECLQDALDRNERFGVWGGLSERERRILARQPNPIRRCPAHGERMSGGPVLYHCPAGLRRHGVTTADLDQAADAGNDAA